MRRLPNMMRLAPRIALAAVLAAPGIAIGQGYWVPGHGWSPYGPFPFPYGPFMPPYAYTIPPYAWSGASGRGAYQRDLPSCYRMGRCTLQDIARSLDRLERLDRLAPSAPEARSAVPYEPRNVPPTDAAIVQPPYAHSGEVLPQHERSGQPLD